MRPRPHRRAPRHARAAARERRAISASYGSSHSSAPSSQSAIEVSLASRSPKPAAISGCGAAHRVGRSAKTAIGPCAFTVILAPSITVGAPIEVKPSTEAAVGSEMNSEPMRWLMTRATSVMVPDPTPMKMRGTRSSASSTWKAERASAPISSPWSTTVSTSPTLGAQRRLGPRAERRIGVVVSDEDEMRKLALPAEAHQFG